MKEIWEKWEPIENLAAKYYIDAVLDTIEDFKIILSQEDKRNNKIHIIFENSVDAYRSTDESFRLHLIETLDKRYGSDFYGDWTFFKVKNSLYIQWLSEQSYGISEDLNFIHFSFVAADSILDVVTNYEPKVLFIKSA
jgi:hypothetical protein